MLSVIGQKRPNIAIEPVIWRLDGGSSPLVLIATNPLPRGGNFVIRLVKTSTGIKKSQTAGKREKSSTRSKKKIYYWPLADAASLAVSKIGECWKLTISTLKRNSGLLMAFIQLLFEYLFGKKKWITFKYFALIATELKLGVKAGRQKNRQADLFVAPPEKPIAPKQEVLL